jgi:hypothetical protein
MPTEPKKKIVDRQFIQFAIFICLCTCVCVCVFSTKDFCFDYLREEI